MIPSKLIKKVLVLVGVAGVLMLLRSPEAQGDVIFNNGKLRDELLNVEIFTTLFEAQVLIERWRKNYNRIRPHSALGYRPPAPEAIMPSPYLGTLTLCVVQ